ncbi:hypothetical protein [Xenorhabdus bovienii]|nr:hypothetical protein [Xenorhabdus bovienii]
MASPKDLSNQLAAIRKQIPFAIAQAMTKSCSSNRAGSEEH